MFIKIIIIIGEKYPSLDVTQRVHALWRGAVSIKRFSRIKKSIMKRGFDLEKKKKIMKDFLLLELQEIIFNETSAKERKLLEIRVPILRAICVDSYLIDN